VGGKRLARPMVIHRTTFADDPDTFTREEELHSRIYALAEKSWAKEISDRPSIVDMKNQLTSMLEEENILSTPMRDVGAECYAALEAKRGRGNVGERGGSVIRPKGVTAE